MGKPLWFVFFVKLRYHSNAFYFGNYKQNHNNLIDFFIAIGYLKIDKLNWILVHEVLLSNDTALVQQTLE